MTPSNVLDTLIEESRKSRDAAGRVLADDRRAQQLTARQLETLRHYKHEYHVKLSDALVHGMDVGALANYQRFIYSLDNAIGSANRQLQQDISTVHASQQRWKNEQRQLCSYNTLASRRAARASEAEARREQRRSDESTTNAQARRRSGAA